MMRPLERNPKKLMREMEARIKLRDIRHLHQSREELQPRWYESLVYILLFPSAFGLLFTLIQTVESGRYIQGNDLVIARFFYVWLGAFILGLSAMMEVLLNRLRALRRVTEALMDEVMAMHRDRPGDNPPEEKS